MIYTTEICIHKTMINTTSRTVLFPSWDPAGREDVSPDYFDVAEVPASRYRSDSFRSLRSLRYRLYSINRIRVWEIHESSSISAICSIRRLNLVLPSACFSHYVCLFTTIWNPDCLSCLKRFQLDHSVVLVIVTLNSVFVLFLSLS